MSVHSDRIAVTLSSAPTVVGGQESGQLRRTTGAEALMDALRRHGVDTIFGYPGGAILPMCCRIEKIAETVRRQTQVKS